MSDPKTLRQFEKMFTAEIRAARGTYSAILSRPVESEDERITYYRDLLIAETALVDLYERAMAAMPLPPSGNPADSIIFYALSNTALLLRREAQTTQRSLNALLTESNANNAPVLDDPDTAGARS